MTDQTDQAGRQAGRHFRQTGRQTDRRDRHFRQTDRQTDRQCFSVQMAIDTIHLAIHHVHKKQDRAQEFRDQNTKIKRNVALLDISSGLRKTLETEGAIWCWLET